MTDTNPDRQRLIALFRDGATVISQANFNKAADELERTADYDALRARLEAPFPMLLWCPRCGVQHVDAPDHKTGWMNPPHRSHLCHVCGCIWRPSDRATVGIAAISTSGKDDAWIGEEMLTMTEPRAAIAAKGEKP